MKRLLLFFLLLSSSVTLAESGAYRVEVIIFRHLQTAQEPNVVGELRKFSQFPALEKDQLSELWPTGQLPDLRAELSAEVAREPTATRIDPVAGATANESADNTSGNPANDLPDDLVPVTELGRRMGGVWRRLRSSRDYQPLVYAAWEQNRTDYYPPIRIHDQQVIDIQLQPPTHIMIADLAARDPLAVYRSFFYRLDGSVQLRRSRFLHLHLDLVYRNELVETETGPATPDASDFGTVVNNSRGRSVFVLQENRQIRTAQLQYFDTPFLGALVSVTAISNQSEPKATQP